MKHLFLFFCLTFSQQIWAAPEDRTNTFGVHGVFFQTNLRPVLVDQNNTRDDTGSSIPTATESGLGSDVSTMLAYVYEGTYLLGLTYNYYNISTFRGNVSGGGSAGLEEKVHSTETGVSLGALVGSWRFIYTYYVGGKWGKDTRNFDETGTTGDVSFENTGLNGYQLEIGYSLPITSWFEVGGGLVYKSRNYYEQSKVNRLLRDDPFENYSSRKLYTKKVDNSLNPMISMIVRF